MTIVPVSYPEFNFFNFLYFHHLFIFGLAILQLNKRLNSIEYSLLCRF
jgi:hypothetical protein